ncbi:MAG: glycerophosphoryl diester phosphodiesterase membrane domain-containing protein [Peptostreptococcaceae bacterium]|nr:glycerophosphoryl diester phosphodiesterase membrane domain-containing protein [Peptostreptococcaceae bacterium]
MERKVNKIANFGKIVWLYTKYQLITKGLLFLLIFPASSQIMKMLLRSTGRTNISSGDFLGFIFSIQGAGMLLLGSALLALLVGTDINAFIIMSALIREGRIKMTAKQLLFVGIRSLKNFLKPAGLLLMLYIAIIIPLVGIGFTIAPMEGFAIPNFITDVIFKNKLYSTLYVVLMTVLSIISVLHLFTFHYVLLCDLQIGEGLKNARALMKRHWRSFLVDFVLVLLAIAIVVAVILVGAIVLLVLNAHRISEDPIISRMIMMWGMLFVAEVIAFLLFMTVPIIADRLTVLFYRYNLKDGHPIELKVSVDASVPGEEAFSKIRLRTKMLLALLGISIVSVNLLIASFCAVYFDEIFRSHRRIDIVAHRGGGDLAAENSIASLEAVIKEGVAWSEIDVQRTKDGKHIINHDPTFKRVTGDPRRSTDLTLDEIKELRINDLFDSSRPSQEVATIEEFLDRAKGRIGLFVELKGSTADQKMADDVIAMIKERDMLKETAILSLDYSLIQYVEEHYPEIDTGFLYFFSIGETAKMKGDILIMEEQEATPEKVAEIQKAGKKAIVWTVNTEESIDKFVNSNVDGIITDYVLRVKEGMDRRDSRSDYEIIIDNFLD